MNKRVINKVAALILTFVFLPFSAYSATISFIGELDLVEVDNGTGIYSGVPLGTTFSGFIDDVTFGGQISDGTTVTSFSCCIAAGGLSVSNDIVLDMDAAMVLNTAVGSSIFSAGDTVDLIDIEGDEATASGGRIEVGLSYLFAGDTFNDESLSNYPFDPNDVLLSAFFILEENAAGEDIYAALGQLNVVPIPASVWLLGTGMLFIMGLVKRRGSD